MKTLTKTELAIWEDFQLIIERLNNPIERSILKETNLAKGEFRILNTIRKSGGEMSQSELVTHIGWEKSRLSHYVKRIEGKGLLETKKKGREKTVIITPEGQEAVTESAPVISDIIRHQFIETLERTDIESIEQTAERLKETEMVYENT
ncbi:MarR family winged helix-turn-helix transcriptional regulator [Lactococcus insecticola]|uniref:MarR family transcriptional regulator n=1 Tax=Pseudolactococcus insecticola TaxID=2709158 RepID=A0A6A0B767_9LACT|nr:MarR family winged helix-turn-helix transcriptional regulator [Lactococcus insecticola]GFH40513.1 MarR family transcriptional regulator [Lactococcus insecticola]